MKSSSLFSCILLSCIFYLCGGQRTSYQNFIGHDQTFNCTIDRILQGEWYSRENNEDRVTNIDATTMTGRGTCKTWQTNHGGEYWFIFTEDARNPEACHHCVNIFVRTVNILEKRESGCVQLSRAQVASLKHENMIDVRTTFAAMVHVNPCAWCVYMYLRPC